MNCGRDCEVLIDVLLTWVLAQNGVEFFPMVLQVISYAVVEMDVAGLSPVQGQRSYRGSLKRVVLSGPGRSRACWRRK